MELFSPVLSDVRGYEDFPYGYSGSKWDGLNIMAWKKEGLQNHPDYKFFKQTLEDAKHTSMELLKDRIPAPQFKETGAGKSQERILMTYLCSSTGGGIKTQKIDFSRFYSALCKHIVNSD